MKKVFLIIQCFLLLTAVGCNRPPKKGVASIPPAVVVAPKEVEIAKTIPVVPLPIPKTETQARVAIIIDDAGHNLAPMDELLSLPVRFDIAVLPRLKFSKEVANKLHAAGYEIMLHQPMQPKGGSDPGPGAIYDYMNEEEIAKILEENFKEVPNLVGVNNHMGSKATSNQQVMEAVLKTTQKNKLFFVDSLTTATKVKQAAAVVGVSFQTRDVFLDNDKNPEAIKTQLRQLKKIALKKGSAIGIGHFFPVTIQSIAEILPEFQKEGIEIVPVSQLME